MFSVILVPNLVFHVICPQVNMVRLTTKKACVLDSFIVKFVYPTILQIMCRTARSLNIALNSYTGPEYVCPSLVQHFVAKDVVIWLRSGHHDFVFKLCITSC